MAKRYYEYFCVGCGPFEVLREEKYRACPTDCPTCKGIGMYRVSAPRVELEGITGDFPTAADKWAKKHIERARKENKEAEESD